MRKPVEAFGTWPSWLGMGLLTVPSSDDVATFGFFFIQFAPQDLTKRDGARLVSAGQALKVEAQKDTKKLSVIKMFSAAGLELPDAFVFPGKKVKPEWKEACGPESLVLANDVGSVTTLEWADYIKKTVIPGLVRIREQHAPGDSSRKMLLFVDG